MRFKQFFNEDLTMNGNNATQSNNQNMNAGNPNNATQNNSNTPAQTTNFVDPAMKRIQQSLTNIDKDAKSVTNVMNRKAIVNSTQDMQNMLKNGANPQAQQAQNNIAQRNMQNIKTGTNMPNRMNMPNQANVNPNMMGNAGNAAN